ncbi:hypothetical protein CHARACLAT_024429 [Characodon lateralis]|uniref:Uncharacterized protein n=1 Tax=Characodon lateralis TaxID=208331 RepID=A0ABU7EXI8_9TELE|nr:hypothetical protein [Characodon lateralis]
MEGEATELSLMLVEVQSKDVAMLLKVKYQNTKKYIRLLSGFTFWISSLRSNTSLAFLMPLSLMLLMKPTQ